jgi:hypothetical protein
MKSKARQVWGNTSDFGETNRQPQSLLEESDKQDTIYTVSAAARLTNVHETSSQRDVPFFGCPRIYSDTARETKGQPNYVQQRFEETDLLPAFVMATAASSLEGAFDVLFRSHPPQNPSLSGTLITNGISYCLTV